MHDVVSPKDCPVGKLSDEASVGDVHHWCGSIEKHLESDRTWKGAGALLRAVRRHPTVVNKAEFDAIRNKISEDYSEGGFMKLSKSDWI